MSSRAYNSRGSLSLTMLASISSGLLFVLLFMNLVRYLLASHAVEHAAEEAARCISPTDGDCVAELAPATAENRDWFAAEQATVKTTWTDRYDYTATVYRQDWEATVDGYQVRMVEEPSIGFTAFRLPLATFHSGLNRFEYRFKSVSARVLAEMSELHYRVPGIFAAAQTNFPDFDADYEVRLEEASVSAWRPRTLVNRAVPAAGFRNFNELSFQAVQLPGRVLPAGSVGEFTTDYFEVPLLPTDSPAVTCIANNGTTCDVTRYAAGTGINDYSWSKYAALAVKPFAEVRRTSGNPSIGWRGAPGAEGKHWGLQLELLSPADYQSYKAGREAALASGQLPPPAPRGTLRCLGGRTATDSLPSQNPRGYHMWLRGPKGANGGGDPNCPAAQNALNEKHDSIFVERGGAYRITGFLEVGQSGAVEVTVSFQHYFDTYEPYQKTVQRQTSCAATNQAGVNEGDAACDAQAACGKLPILSVFECRVIAIERKPVCLSELQAGKDPYAFPLSGVDCAPPQSAALCNTNDRPSQAVDCSAELASNPGRIGCGWLAESSPDAFTEVLQAPAGCALASAVTKEISCGQGPREVVYRPDGSYGEAAQCPNFLSALRQYRTTVERLNAAQPAGTPRLPEQSAEAHWNTVDFSKERWAPMLSIAEELRASAANSEVVRRGISQSRNLRPQFRHYDPAWLPTLSAFGFYNLAADDAHASTAVKLRLLAERPFSIETGYPFATNPEFEISPGNPSGGSCSEQYGSIEERLRAYAAAVIPEVGDPDVVMETAANYVDSIATAKVGSCNPADNFSTPLPVCTKASYVQKETPICEQRRYLGRYSTRDFPNGPPICSTSDTYRCFSESNDGTLDASSTEQLNVLAAQRKGLTELQRIFPGAALSCEGFQCASISVSEPDPDHVSVAVSYQLPLGFPLSSIFGNDFLNVRSTKLEMREQSVAGRFADADSEQAG